jgi:ABC-type nitrate/sulfonate/bicarbonate transport system substrate-binding protein
LRPSSLGAGRPTPGPIINEGFASGTIDIASYGDLPSIIANAAGVRTELIVPSGRGSDTHLLVPPDSSAQSILDLKGKRIAIHRGRPWELPFSRLIDSVGLRAPAHREHRFQRIVNTHSTIVNTPASASSAMSGKGGDAA